MVDFMPSRTFQFDQKGASKSNNYKDILRENMEESTIIVKNPIS